MIFNLARDFTNVNIVQTFVLISLRVSDLDRIKVGSPIVNLNGPALHCVLHCRAHTCTVFVGLTKYIFTTAEITLFAPIMFIYLIVSLQCVQLASVQML